MKQAILLYNAYAGHRHIVGYLDLITDRLQQIGYELRLHRSMRQGDIRSYTEETITEENTDLILVSGGDGTVNECISAMCTKGLDIPLLILPLGTANDFATTAGIPGKVEEALKLLEEGKLTAIDVGKVNEKYFINVCDMGLFSGISHTVDQEMKKTFGRLAYYSKGVEEIQNYQAMDITMTTENETLRGRYLLILVFNGKGAGGMLQLAKPAEITDGKLDVVAIKDINLMVVPALFLKVLQGEHLKDSNVDYFTASKLTITCHNQEENRFITDVDGEPGATFPLHIEVISGKIRIYLPQS